ncbi:hypothetical protein F5878DRAFT_370177 [Lentinula raphanica]|uniref:Uncharacterized protein n=1 Tax=Lentinula raphanica TaxID=153919 RepID=A0AA38UJ08_9AGAR|nr:hypothetical protein F5880DRAFT_1614992 [Lentinula raphanica]KAJ3842716.1 hypothetical protein F5878DRAFT_370177 [Lentinula raphanica]
MLFNKLFAGCVLSMTYLGVFASPLALGPRSVPSQSKAEPKLPTGKTKVEIGISISRRKERDHPEILYDYGIVLNEAAQRYRLVLHDSRSELAVKDQGVSIEIVPNRDPSTHLVFDPKMQVEVDLTSAVSCARTYAASSSRACLWIEKVVNYLFLEATGKDMSVDVKKTVREQVVEREARCGIPKTCPISDEELENARS